MHGANTRAVARHTIAELAAKQGLELPEVKPRDFQRVAAEMIAWNVKQFAELGAELEGLRMLGTAVQHVREYGDLLDRLDQWGRTISVLIKAAAALPVPPEAPPEAPAAERIAEVLRGIEARMQSLNGGRCHACGQPRPVAGEVMSEDAAHDGMPAAEVLPFAPPEPIEEPSDLL